MRIDFPRPSRSGTVPSGPVPTEEELFAMRKAAWHKQEIVVIRLTDVRDDIIRQVLINEAIRLYGHREIA